MTDEEKKRQDRRVIAPLWVLDELKAIVAELGTEETSEKIGCSRATLARVMASLPVYPGTLALVEAKLKVKAPVRPVVQDAPHVRRRFIDRK